MAWPVLPNGWEAWRIEEILGEGSYGTVYKAARKIGEDTVYSAIKIIRIPESAQEAKALEQELNSREAAREYCRDLATKCMKEIRAMDSLKGITNIVNIEDGVMTENEDGFGWTIYIRMELLTCFTDYVTLHTLKEEDVIRMGTDLCTALSCCEKVNIIHRDIKPSNIFRSRTGNYKLGDFGVARKMDKTSGLYSARGTYPFMAPEVFKCSPYDHRADIYSLGLVLYRQMNRNRDPFVDLNKSIIYAKDREEAMSRRLGGEPLPPPADAFPGLAKVILKACDPDPEKRYKDAAAFRTALEQIGKSKKQKTGGISRWLLPGLLALAVLMACLWFFLGGRAGNRTGNPSVTEVPTATMRAVPTAELTEASIREDDPAANGTETNETVSEASQLQVSTTSAEQRQESALEGAERVDDMIWGSIRNGNTGTVKSILKKMGEDDASAEDFISSHQTAASSMNNRYVHILAQTDDVCVAEAVHYLVTYTNNGKDTQESNSGYWLYLRKVNGKWGPTTLTAEETEVLDNVFYHNFGIQALEAGNNGLNFARFGNMMWTKHDGVEKGAYLANAAYMYQTAGGDVVLLVSLANGTDAIKNVKSITVTMTDNKLGKLFTIEENCNIRVLPGTRELYEIRVPASKVKKGTWTTINSDINTSY